MNLLQSLRAFRDYMELPPRAKRANREDRRGLPEDDVDIDRAIHEGIAWLGRAQDRSASRDGGVARHFSLLDGWSTSYPETTGYIIPTMFEYARIFGEEEARRRAKRMLDWLVSIQFPDGAFQGGMIDSEPVVPVTFNTGQILIGLAAGVGEYGDDYRGAMRRAADWLVETQDSDGCWRKHGSPFAKPGEKVYETHVAWGLFEAARIDGDRNYGEAALRNARWALSSQRGNGWFGKCCLTDPDRPLTHTLGYTLRGLIEAYRFSDDPEMLRASTKTADGLLGAIRGEDGFLPGRLSADWQGAAPWACLTGSVQIAACLFLLYRFTGKREYRDAALLLNRYVRQTVKHDGHDNVRGGIKGSFPVSGGYGTYQYLNWACKFFIDSLILERDIGVE